MDFQNGPRYTPGNEPPELKEKLESFFRIIDDAFPDRIIVWNGWNHKDWDSTANLLMKKLGYSRGIYFLNAYLYFVVFDADYLSGKVEKQTVPDPRKIYTGTIASILKYGRSGFVHCNETDRDHYINILDFSEKTKLIEKGRRVSFHLKTVFNRKRGEYTTNAVKLSYEKDDGEAYAGK